MTTLAGQGSADPAIAPSDQSASSVAAATDTAAVDSAPTASSAAVDVVATNGAEAASDEEVTAPGTVFITYLYYLQCAYHVIYTDSSSNNLSLVPHVAAASATLQPPPVPPAIPNAAAMAYPQLTSAGSRWYVVTRGRRTGVFLGWQVFS